MYKFNFLSAHKKQQRLRFMDLHPRAISIEFSIVALGGKCYRKPSVNKIARPIVHKIFEPNFFFLFLAQEWFGLFIWGRIQEIWSKDAELRSVLANFQHKWKKNCKIFKNSKISRKIKFFDLEIFLCKKN